MLKADYSANEPKLPIQWQNNLEIKVKIWFHL